MYIEIVIRIISHDQRYAKTRATFGNVELEKKRGKNSRRKRSDRETVEKVGSLLTQNSIVLTSFAYWDTRTINHGPRYLAHVGDPRGWIILLLSFAGRARENIKSGMTGVDLCARLKLEEPSLSLSLSLSFRWCTIIVPMVVNGNLAGSANSTETNVIIFYTLIDS